MASILGFSVVDYGNTALKPYKITGTDVTISLRSETAPIFIEFARWFHTTIEPLRKGECWGHAYRPIRGGTNPSRHSAGIAVDLNAPRHPMGRRGTFSSSQAAKIRAKCTSLGLRWGGDYTGRPDEMHVELNVSRARALAIVRALQTPVAKKTTTAARTWTAWAKVKPGVRTVDRWDRGEDVKVLQRYLGLRDDGHFGPATETKVKQYQAMRGIPADGIVGPVTWRHIMSGLG